MVDSVEEGMVGTVFEWDWLISRYFVVVCVCFGLWDI
jgi:phage shock protein PspC (stress-responsive transcriptional regulator)